VSIITIDPDRIAAALDEPHVADCPRKTTLLFNPCKRCTALVLGRHLIPEDLWLAAFGPDDADWIREHLLHSGAPVG
jgi:hypothetical protein